MKETEETRFTQAFYEILEQDPSRPPGPTAINRLLNERYSRNRKRTPDNTLNGRMSVLRRRLLLENGFVQDEKWGRWRKAS